MTTATTRADTITCPHCGARSRVPAAARSIPMLLILEHGTERARQVGAVGPDVLQKWIEGVLSS